MKLSTFIFIFLAAGCLDWGSTMIGISLGLVESHPAYLQAPFVASLLLLLWSYVTLKIPDIPSHVKRGVIAWLFLLAFFPGIWNISLILYTVII